MQEKRKKLPVFIIGSLVCFNILAWLALGYLSKEQSLEIVFFDVGQGDSIFIETPARHQILIDGGPDSSVLNKLGKEMPFWDRTIDLVLLTHPDYDHLRGLLDVLDAYKVENILWTGVVKETKTFKKWLEKIEAERANIIIAERGQRIKAGNTQMYILHPLENLSGQFFEGATNNTSVVAKLVFGQNTFLLTGDITKKSKREILDVGDDLRSEVMKVAHHGSKTSSSEEFLEAVAPRLAVISSGRNNPYGHPRPEVLAKLEESGIRILRTDQQGDIIVRSNGKTIISNF